MPTKEELETFISYAKSAGYVSKNKSSADFLSMESFSGVLSHYYWSPTTFVYYWHLVVYIIWNPIDVIFCPIYSLFNYSCGFNRGKLITYNIWPVRSGR